MIVNAIAAVLFGPVGDIHPAEAADSCAIRQFRWEEDCSSLRGRVLRGLDELRYLPLNDAGSVWLTFGGEYRIKTENLDAPDFGIRASDKAFTAFGQRWLASTDLRSHSGWRVFVQLSAAAEAGRKPIERPFDHSHVDLAQGFLDLPLPVFNSTVLRVGRQELDAGGNRLISTREAANLRLAFDMAHLESTLGNISIVGFYGRPVLNRRNSFDDRRHPGEIFYGGWMSAPLSGAASTLRLFFLSRDRSNAVYEQGVAFDHRRTLGTRFSGTKAAWDFGVQTAYQYGTFGSAHIAASGAAGDVGWHPQVWGQPRAGISFGVASGDSRKADKTLGTFDVLYPNLGYFTDAPVYYPGNTADFQPNISVNVVRTLSVRGGADLVFRVSRRDAVFGPPGLPLITGTGAGPFFVATLAYLRADWTLNPHVQVSISGVHGFTGALVRAAGGRDFSYGALTLDLKE